MKKDLVKEHKSYYSAKNKPEIIQVERAQFISIEGKGDPGAEEFSVSVQALYSIAYAIKFRCKDDGNDFVVPKLEGLWWYDEEQFRGISLDEAPIRIPRDQWQFLLMLRMPDEVGKKHLSDAIIKVLSKRDAPLVKTVQLIEMTEGKCVQMLHVGPFEREPMTLEIINEFMSAYKFEKNGRHHEIYLNDFCRTAPEKLKTILREPVK